MRIFVCDGKSRISLQIVRSLAQRGHKIHVGESIFGMCFLSNTISQKTLYPNPESSPKQFFEFILGYIERYKIEYIIPVTDATLGIISKKSNELPSFCRAICPNYQEIIRVQNKGNLIKQAKEYGLPCPKTHYLTNIINTDEILSNFNYPFIAKPEISSGSRGIYLIKNKKGFDTFLKNLDMDKESYIIQEYIPHGGAIGVYCLCREGEVIALNTHFRIREYPHSGGPSTLRRSARHSVSEHFSKKILNKLKWNGVAMVEFRIHKKTKIPYLMEINPRFWGSLSVDIHSGVDFPSLLLDFSEGQKVNFSRGLTGVFVRWLFIGDILWLLTHPSKIKALTKFLDFANQKFDVLNTSDPMPVIGALLEGLISLFDKERREHVFTRGF